MTAVVFVGPTLAHDQARAELDAVYRPPASQGDVYRAALGHPRAIGLVDGFFERVPAVWHKEILWAMSQGIHVYGSASMGALRAAELAPFGMEGVGAVFEAYRDGLLEDDDEVAVAHGPAESGYRPLSEAMVNIRATLAAAEAAGIVSAPVREALTRIAKALFYPERAYPLVVRRGAEAGLPAAELAALTRWLPAGAVNRKRDDAVAMLRRMRQALDGGAGPKEVRYTFQYTEPWDYVRRLAPDPRPRAGEPLDLERLLDELRLQGDAAVAARQAALFRALALDESRRYGFAPGPAAVQEAATGLQRAHGLETAADLARWGEAQGLAAGELQRLVEDAARLAWVAALVERDAAAQLANHLRVTGQYARLRARAQAKERALEGRGLADPDLADTGLTEAGLFRWYFERLGRPLPSDLARHAVELGFADDDAFRRAVVREYCYLVVG